MPSTVITIIKHSPVPRSARINPPDYSNGHAADKSNDLPSRNDNLLLSGKSSVCEGGSATWEKPIKWLNLVSTMQKSLTDSAKWPFDLFA